MIAQKAPGREREVVLYDQTRQPSAQVLPQDSPVLDFRGHALLHCGLVVAELRVVCQIPPGGRQVCNVRPERVQGRLRVQDILTKRAKRRSVRLHVHTGGQKVQLGEGNPLIEGEAAEDRQTTRWARPGPAVTAQHSMDACERLGLRVAQGGQSGPPKHIDSFLVLPPLHDILEAGDQLGKGTPTMVPAGSKPSRQRLVGETRRTHATATPHCARPVATTPLARATMRMSNTTTLTDSCTSRTDTVTVSSSST